MVTHTRGCDNSWLRQPPSFLYTTGTRCLPFATVLIIHDIVSATAHRCVGMCVCVHMRRAADPGDPAPVGVRCRRRAHPAWAATLGKTLRPGSSLRPALEVDAVIVVELLHVPLASLFCDGATSARTMGRASHPTQIQSSAYLVLAPPGPSSVCLSGHNIGQACLASLAPSGGPLLKLPHPPRTEHVRTDQPSTAHTRHT